MPRSRHSDALRAAQMYYLQDLTMDAIARELRTSRSTVSRLLSSARETGLVQIQIRSPLDTGPELERHDPGRSTRWTSTSCRCWTP